MVINRKLTNGMVPGAGQLSVTAPSEFDRLAVRPFPKLVCQIGWWAPESALAVRGNAVEHQKRSVALAVTGGDNVLRGQETRKTLGCGGRNSLAACR